MFVNKGACFIWHSCDTNAELELVCSQAMQAGAFDAVQCTHWSEGGAGALTLAEAVRRAATLPGQFKFLYDSQVLVKVVLVKVIVKSKLMILFLWNIAVIIENQ